MKKYISTIIIALILLTSCSKENNELFQGGSSIEESKSESSGQMSDDTDDLIASDITESENISSEEKVKKVYIIRENFTMEVVKNNNLINDDGSREHLVFLPPSYYESEKSYPLVYYFHGYGDDSSQIRYYDRDLNAVMESGELKEMIVVAVNYSNSYGGTFMADSQVTGLWETGFIEEFMPYVEDKYRVISDKNSRGLIGFSMGGYSAMDLAIKYPDKFNAVYSICPALLEDADIDELFCGQDEESPYGMAFAPNPNAEKLYDYPVFDGSIEDNVIIERWKDGYMNHDLKIIDYLAKDSKLSGIGIEAALNDDPFLKRGYESFIIKLEEAEIDVNVVRTNNHHQITSEIFVEHGMKFLQKHLYIEEPRFVLKETITLESIRDFNVLDDHGRRYYSLFLPNDYYETNKSYPVIYYFHGFGGSTSEFGQIYPRIKAATINGDIPEAIYVAISYNSNIGGSFAENSEVTGHWEDAFTDEVIPFIDGKYRTMATSESRGLVGFSMGGYSVIKLGLNNPDLIGGIFAYGPGCLKDDEFNIAMDSWAGDTRFLRAYAGAFADGFSQEPSEAIPSLDGSDSDNELIDMWLDGFGHMEEKIAIYMEKENQLLAIGLEVGSNDYYSWIYTGTKHFHDLLEEAEIEHVYNQTGGGHTIDNTSVVTICLPFLFDNLVTKD